MPDGTKRPIAFASRTLSPAEHNYIQVEKEALSLIFCIHKFHQYLYGRTFTIITDHKPWTTILSPEQGIPTLSAARMQRWALLLSAYSYIIQFQSTQSHGNANGLSCLPLQEVRNQLPEDASIFNLAQMDSLPVQSAKLMASTRVGHQLKRVLHFV